MAWFSVCVFTDEPTSCGVLEWSAALSFRPPVRLYCRGSEAGFNLHTHTHRDKHTLQSMNNLLFFNHPACICGPHPCEHAQSFCPYFSLFFPNLIRISGFTTESTNNDPDCVGLGSNTKSRLANGEKKRCNILVTVGKTAQRDDIVGKVMNRLVAMATGGEVEWLCK